MTTTQKEGRFAEFRRLSLQDEAEAFGAALAAEGFTAVRRFLDDFRDYLRSFADEQTGTAMFLLAQGRRALPEPGRISPSWAEVWTEFGRIAAYKSEAMARIPADARGGEWQVLLDNPHSSGSIAVYPGLTFMEAAYLYAYFRSGLEPSEYIRLQRVDTVIMNTGKGGRDE